MNLLTLFGRRATAPVARERLQILLSHERNVVRGGRHHAREAIQARYVQTLKALLA